MNEPYYTEPVHDSLTGFIVVGCMVLFFGLLIGGIVLGVLMFRQVHRALTSSIIMLNDHYQPINRLLTVTESKRLGATNER